MTNLTRTHVLDEQAWTEALDADDRLRFIALVNSWAHDVFMVLYQPMPRLNRPPASDVLSTQQYDFLAQMMEQEAYASLHDYTMTDEQLSAHATVTLLGNGGKARERELVDA
jgi:hypothetical protein